MTDLYLKKKEKNKEKRHTRILTKTLKGCIYMKLNSFCPSHFG